MNVELPDKPIEAQIVEEDRKTEKKDDPFDILDINGGEPLPEELK